MAARAISIQVDADFHPIGGDLGYMQEKYTLLQIVNMPVAVAEPIKGNGATIETKLSYLAKGYTGQEPPKDLRIRKWVHDNGGAWIRIKVK